MVTRMLRSGAVTMVVPDPNKETWTADMAIPLEGDGRCGYCDERVTS